MVCCSIPPSGTWVSGSMSRLKSQKREAVGEPIGRISRPEQDCFTPPNALIAPIPSCSCDAPNWAGTLVAEFSEPLPSQWFAVSEDDALTHVG